MYEEEDAATTQDDDDDDDDDDALSVVIPVTNPWLLLRKLSHSAVPKSNLVLVCYSHYILP